MADSKPTRVFEIEIEAPRERVWEAIVSPEQTKAYYHGTSFQGELKAGAPYTYQSEDGEAMIEGQIVEVDPPRKLVTTFHALWDDSVAGDKPSLATWTLEERGAVTKVTVTHEFDEECATYQVVTGWEQILSGLKSLLETGKVAASA